MADLGQDRDGLELKILEVEQRIRQQEAAKINLEVERKADELNIKRYTAKLKNYDEHLKQIDKQIEDERKNVLSLKEALAKLTN